MTCGGGRGQHFHIRRLSLACRHRGRLCKLAGFCQRHKPRRLGPFQINFARDVKSLKPTAAPPAPPGGPADTDTAPPFFKCDNAVAVFLRSVHRHSYTLRTRFFGAARAIAFRSVHGNAYTRNVALEQCPKPPPFAREQRGIGMGTARVWPARSSGLGK